MSLPSTDAAIFLAALDAAGADFTFQTFDDTPEKKPGFAQVNHGPFEAHADYLARMNARGAGVFVTVNATDGMGRKANNVQRVRALFVDLDGSPLQPVLDNSPLAPQIIVESSPDRWHAYWLVRDCPLDRFKVAQQVLAKRFAGDEKVCDLPRVMRLPGFEHRKGAPFVTRIHQLSEQPPWAWDALAAAFDLAPEVRKPAPLPAARPFAGGDAGNKHQDLIDDLRDALRVVPADDWKDWSVLGLALKTLGNDGLILWLEWSQSSSKFEAKSALKEWERFKPTAVSHLSVFEHAKQHGWDPARSPSVQRKRAARAQQPRAPQAPPPTLEDYPDFTPPDDAGEGAESFAAAEPPQPAAAAIGELTHNDLLARYELVHGKTDVWDCDRSERMPFAAFAAIVGNDAAKAWKADTKKRVKIVVEKRVEKSKPRKPGTDPTVLDELLARYSLIYGTEAVFDHRDHIELTLGALRAFAGLKATRDWTDHPRRRVVSLEDVQFAPQREVDDPEICNLWRGWAAPPREGAGQDAERLTRWLRVLHYVFGESDNVVDWVLKWMAYPLQYPGTKMTTSIILHGPEGTGKNTVADAVRRIYGRYGRSITQTQLESQWTDWISCRLFIVGNEVLHRQEQITQKGRIKTLITEPTVTVERKHLPGREEPNMANLMFLSNELVPLNIDKGDRRFLVQYSPPPHPDGPAFYMGLSEKSMPMETVQALHWYLLNKVDCTGFDAHTKPPMTDAKQMLIDASMASDERFIREWMAGETRLPYLPVTADLLFDAYDYWCRRNGERYIRPSNKFKATVIATGVPASPGPVRYLAGSDYRQARFYMPPLPPSESEKSMGARLGACVDFFTAALREWKHTQ